MKQVKTQIQNLIFLKKIKFKKRIAKFSMMDQNNILIINPMKIKIISLKTTNYIVKKKINYHH